MQNTTSAAAVALSLLLCAPLALAAAPVAAAQTSASSHAQAQPQKQARAAGVWIDVRSAREFEAGHLEGALNVPVDRIAQEIATISPNKDAPINLYCRSGARAEAALKELKALGYTRVENHGGYKDLIAKGLR